MALAHGLVWRDGLRGPLIRPIDSLVLLAGASIFSLFGAALCVLARWRRAHAASALSHPTLIWPS